MDDDRGKLLTTEDTEEHRGITQKILGDEIASNALGGMGALIIAAVLMMVVSDRLDLLVIALPVAALVAYSRARRAGRSGQHRI